jgi:two-component system response regulator RegA
MSERALLLIVEDDIAFRTRLGRAFEARGFDVRTAATVDEAEAIVRDEPPELALVDLRMPGRSGLELIPILKDADPATRIVVLTGYGSIATAVEAVRRGATEYLTKPADADQILAAFAGPDGTMPAVPPTQTMSLDRMEWEHINRVLVECQGNVSKTARILGIHRRSLQRKLAKYPSGR